MSSANNSYAGWARMCAHRGVTRDDGHERVPTLLLPAHAEGGQQ